MTVKIGSARISENGTINGKKGDSTGREVCIEDWYLHKKGWVCLEAKNPEVRNRIAYAIRAICENDNFGYGQSDRDSCLKPLEAVNWNPAKVTTPVNIDCSLAVYVACRYAGIPIVYDSTHAFYTGNLTSRLKQTGQFNVYTDKAHCEGITGLVEGDILCTKTKGHVVTVVSTDKLTAKNTWLKENNYWYRLNASGERLKGYHLISDNGKNRPCYFDTDGRLMHEASDRRGFLEVWCDN